tara:strand:+ start:1343 stop:1528 length:186 start_codon:yes stop_codon:yes gene_type:complete
MDKIISDIIDYEDGNMDRERMVGFFQTLIDNGMAWSLQGHYGRTAMALIEDGVCVKPDKTK